MFTGIVEEFGRVRSVTQQGPGVRIVIEASAVLTDVAMGASIAVNGCCLTVVDWGNEWWAADAVPETLDRTTIGSLSDGDHVNLERPMPADGRFGGHIVQGHVDAVATIVGISDLKDGSRRFSFTIPAALDPYLVEKGSVTIDGASLTVASVDADTFDVALIPHTLERTTFGHRVVGSEVNIEADCIAKYVERLVATGRVANHGGTPA